MVNIMFTSRVMLIKMYTHYKCGSDDEANN